MAAPGRPLELDRYPTGGPVIITAISSFMVGDVAQTASVVERLAGT